MEINRQYIGARYVPTFYESPDGGSEWDAGRAYERLTIVSYLGSSYTSKKAVPPSVGAPVDNPEYWVLTGNYNGQVEQYRQTVEEYKRESVDAIDELRDYVYARVNALSVFPLTGIKCLLIGNSYARGVGTANFRGWPYYFTEVSGADTVTIQQSGGDFILTGSEAATYPNQNYRQAITSYCSTLSQEEKNSFRYVVFGGGWNDQSYTYEAIKAEVLATVAYIREQMPFAKVCLFPLGSTSTGSLTHEHVQAYNAWAAGALEAGMYGSYVSPYWTFGRPQFAVDGDNVHLNSAGYYEVAKLMCAALMGADAGYQAEHQIDGNYVVRRYTNGTAGMTGRLDRTAALASGGALTTSLPKEFQPRSTSYFPAYYHSEQQTGQVLIKIYGAGQTEAGRVECIFPSGWTTDRDHTINIYFGAVYPL